VEQVVALVERLPLEPGVYIMRDRKGRVIYVGKARKLRNRVRQYFNGHDTRDFVPLLGRIVGDIETVITANDKEALLLENNLIKLHRPRFNVKLRDDKQYIVLRLDPRKAWPRLEVVRNIAQDGARYYGPFHSASRARSTLRVVNRHFQLRTCTDHVLENRARPCLQYQIGRCPAPCVFEVDAEAYGRQVDDVGLFLSGKHEELTDGLRGRMEAAAEAMNFESAAAIRDQLQAVETTLVGQQVVGKGEGDQDLVGMYREGGLVEFAVMHVRSGKLIASSNFSQSGMEMPDTELVRGLLGAYYDDAPFIPSEVLLPITLAEDDREPLAEWLGEKRGNKVRVHTPLRGDKVRLVELANKNAASNFVSRRNRANDSEQLLGRLRERLSLSRLPHRIECFDVSHIQGSDAVASMVVFEDGEPNKKAYRSFKIRGDGGKLAQGTRQNDDFSSMYEVLSRRFRRALDGKDESWALPDLMVIDGGKGQLGRVLAAMDDLGVPLGAEGLDVVSLAKERSDHIGLNRKSLDTLSAAQEGDAKSPTPGQALAEYEVKRARASGKSEQVRVRPERVFIPGAKDAIALAPGSSERYLLERLRDEAHRFAITHHRKRRGKRSLASALDSIEGVGPAMKKKLLTHFGRMAALRGADLTALQAVPGVGPKLAQRLYDALGGPGRERDAPPLDQKPDNT
jgi:excinuclease ABC subunit C